MAARPQQFFDPSVDYNAEKVTERLRLALAVLADVPAGNVVGEEHTSALVVAHDALISVAEFFPSVECWCVVKHYASHDEDPTDPWNPTVWCAFTTEAQARAFGPAIEDHYGNEAKRRGGRRDRFVVERAACKVTQILRPDLAAEDYVKRLGS
jgi:hypothetical protein